MTTDSTTAEDLRPADRAHGNPLFSTALDPMGEKSMSEEINHDPGRFLNIAVMSTSSKGTALITDAFSGIGAIYAHRLASQGS